MNRRRFLTSATSLLLAPALVRASSLDYVPRGDVLSCLKATHDTRGVVYWRVTDALTGKIV